MSVVRKLVLPTVIATPIWLWVFPVSLRGWEALADVNVRVVDLIFGGVFTLSGLLLIGLPSASFIGRFKFSRAVKSIVLLAAGGAGGALIAFLFGFGLSMADAPVIEILLTALAMSHLGLLPGATVALVWTMINFNWLTQPTQGTQHG